MCLIAYAPKGHTIPRAHLDRGLTANSDGWGLWAGGKVYRGLDKKAFWQTWKKLRPGTARVVHFRWATQGDTDLANTHPFTLANGGLLFHNGVIDITTASKSESDTAAFARLIGPLDLRNEDIRRVVSYAVGLGNKLVLVHEATNPHSDVSVIWEARGEWHRGVWYSNSGYKPLPIYTKLTPAEKAFWKGGFIKEEPSTDRSPTTKDWWKQNRGAWAMPDDIPEKEHESFPSSDRYSWSLGEPEKDQWWKR